MFRVGIINVTGYAGMELARLLRFHPSVELVGVTGRSAAGQKVNTVFPHLDDIDQVILEEDQIIDPDVIFSALPHKSSAEACIKYLDNGAKIIDISADFRLDSLEEYEDWYVKHPAPSYISRSVYGLTEVNRKEIANADLVANPGCYPTGALLGLAPLAHHKIITKDVIVDSKSGVSGAGRSLSLNVHFSEVNEDISAYGLDGHRHLPEISQTLGNLDETVDWAVTFTPHLIPVTRGILSTIYAFPKDDTLKNNPKGKDILLELFKEYYRNEPFVRVLDAPPHTKQVAGSNMTQVYPTMDSRTGKIVVVTAIDNLIKGAAGQAIQNMNVMLGIEETLGLSGFALYP
jgi:N-acetyl-gamma-glutamyl-phosphate reductase